ncbi:glycosyltransferase [Actinophytocola sp.]|uniref:glycosyltransferase n=1 Tax=Actinophytocola sp. TaxID=1872138 RepID=UPI002ED5E029
MTETLRTTAAAEQPAPAALSVLLVLKTSEGGLWVLPHIDELRRRGHAVVVVLPEQPGRLRTALAARGVPVVDSPLDFQFRPSVDTLAGLLRLRRLLVRLAPDVLHYHLYASALATRLSSLGLGIPRVHMVAGPLYLDAAPIRMAERFLARLDTVTIGGSAHTVDRYRRLGLPAARTPTIPYGVDTRRFQPFPPERRERARAELGLAPDAFVVVMVAYVYAPKPSLHGAYGVKGHEVLLAAWRGFHAEHPESRLLMVGSGFDEAGERHRQSMVRLFQLDDPDHGVTRVDSTDDVRTYYAAADLSVSPSFSDNHGAVLEASAMGVPSVVSDAGALPEAVPAGCGLVVPAGDVEALANALRHAFAEHEAGRLAAWGRSARDLVVREFSAVRSADAVVDVIERVAGRTPHGARELTLFTEARFVWRQGQWMPVDPVNGKLLRTPYLDAGNRVRVVARAGRRGRRRPSRLDDSSVLHPLPYYVGARGLLRAAPAMSVSVTKAVANAETVVLRLPGPVGTVAGLACQALGRRYAVEIVGDPEEVLRSGVLGLPGKLLARPVAWLQKAIVGRADASRFVTETTLQRRYPPRPGTPTVAVSNVRLDKAAFVSGGRTWRPAPFRVVAVGSHETRYKGHDVLLTAVRLLAASGVPIIATVVGDGRLHGELREQCEEAGLAGTVTFTGALDGPGEIVELLDAASLFVMPSRTEGLPRALVEAMARALPAVGSAVGGIPELLDSSCLVPPDDPVALAGAIRRLLSDPAAWEEQSARNLAVSHRYIRSELDKRFASWLAALPPARPRRRSATSRRELTA